VASITATAIAIGMLYPVSISVAQQRGDAPSPAAGLSVEQKAPGQRREVAGAGARTGATGVAPPLDPAGDGAPSGMLDLNDPESRAARDAPAAVRFRGKPLFEVRTPIGELSIAQRAAAIEARLRELADGPPQGLNALQLFERDGMTEIQAGDTLIRVVTDADARGTGRTRRQLAADQRVAIAAALQVEFRDRTAAALAGGVVRAALATVALVIALVALLRGVRWIRARLRAAALAWHWQSSLARLELLTPANVSAASRAVAMGFGWLLGLGLLYVYLRYVLSQFPWTRGFADAMVATTREALLGVVGSLLDYLPNLVNIAIIVVIARLALKVVRAIFGQLASGRLSFDGFYTEWAWPTYSLVRFFLVAVAAVMIFPYLPGSGSEGFKGISVFVGLLVSLGAASAIANVISGIVLTYMRPFKVGDRVKIADAIGDLTGKDLFVVRLKTIKNVDITIPNALVLANHIVNFSSSAQAQGLILHTTVTIGYDVPWPRVHELLIAAAQGVEGIEREPAPFVLQTRLDDFSVAYELNATTRLPNRMAQLYSQLHAAIQDRFNEAGVEIMSPHFTAVRDGNAATLPTEHLPKNYRAPAFNLLARLQRFSEPKA